MPQTLPKPITWPTESSLAKPQRQAMFQMRNSAVLKSAPTSDLIDIESPFVMGSVDGQKILEL